MSGAAFAKDVQKLIDKSMGRADQVIRAITLQLFSDVIERTPVDSGRLKGNWQVSIAAPITITTDRMDKSGKRTKKAAEKNIGGAGTITYMTNNLPYAYRIEYMGWSHEKAPAGMVGVAFANIQKNVREEARK